MGVIISLEEFRKQRCLAHLLDDIGLPRYCEECGDEGADIVFEALMGSDGDGLDDDVVSNPPARILAFPLSARMKRKVAAANAQHGTARNRQN